MGITAVSDITLLPDLDVYEALLKEDKLNLKISSILPFKEIDNIFSIKERFSGYSSIINFHYFKAFYDGSLSSETAYFHESYKGTDNKGIRTDM